MSTLYNNLKKLYDCELYSNAAQIASLIITAQTIEHSFLTSDQHYNTLVYYGNCLYQEQQYRKAESVFRQALQVRKAIVKLKVNELEFSESEVKYKIGKCLESTKQYSEAITILQTITSKQRTPKINMLLGKLLCEKGNDRHALGPFREVLRECPLNLEAIKCLLSLDVQPTEIISLISDTVAAPQCSDWLKNLIKAYGCMYQSKFYSAIEFLRPIESKSRIGDNELMLVLIGQCFHYNGDEDTALYYLLRAQSRTSYMTNGLVTLAAVLANKNRTQELERLTMPVINTTEYTSDNWFVLAQYLFCQGKFEKASYFVQRACYMNPKNVEGSLLHVKIAIELKRYTEALSCLRNLQQFASYRFEVYELLVELYITLHRLREAQTIATNAVTLLGRTPRTIVLLTRPHLRDNVLKFKARPLLLKALELDDYYLPAVYSLVEIYQDEGSRSEAIKLLKKQVAYQPNSKLYSMLGDLMSQEKEHSEAVENYTIAINLDPTNRRAVSGLIAMGQPVNSTKSDNSYAAKLDSSYPEIIENDDSNDYQENNAFDMMDTPANVVDLESETEVWSDMEIESNNA